MNTTDCKPTLTDSQVLDFCRNGYLCLEGVVDDEVNLKAIDYCNADEHYEPSGILQEDWFIEGVIVNEQASGAIRSLLGANFHLPVLMNNHRTKGLLDGFSGWHVDGNSMFSPAVNYLQVFYYPQDTPVELGPTAVLPGSHLVHNRSRFMSHLNGIRGAVSLTSVSGTIFITDYSIWHRRGPKTMEGVRDMLRYFYWRTVPPTRDWILDPEFDFASANYRSPISSFTEQHRDHGRVAEKFLWLCGQHDLSQNLGGQSWPLPGHRLELPYGYPEGLLIMDGPTPHELRVSGKS